MNAEPVRYDESIRTHWFATGQLGIECTVVHPPSARGRRVLVLFDDEQARHALKEFRSWLIEQRQTSEAAS